MNKYIVIALLLLINSIAISAEDGNKLVEVSLLSEFHTIDLADDFFVAVEISPKKDWHTYWRNAGDAGLATDVSFDLPDGFDIIDTLWQVPKIFYFEGMANYGYSDKHYIIYKIKPNKAYSGKTLEIKASIRWLACKDKCLPGKAKKEMTLEIDEKARKNLQFERIFNDFPKKFSENIYFQFDTDKIIVALNKFSIDSVAYFLPYEEGIIDNGKKQTLNENNMTVYLDSFRSSNPIEIKGLLQIDNKAYEVTLINK